MGRVLSGGLSAHIAEDAHTRCGMLRFDLVDGSVIALTDHDLELEFDLGDGAATYAAETGIRPSDLSLSTGFDVDEVEIVGPLWETADEVWHVTKAMVVGGRFDDAVVRYFQVDWTTLADGPIALLQGRVVLASVEASRFKLVVHSEISKFAQEIGRTITPYCDADFGDARCGATPETLAATVSAVTNERSFTVTFAGSFANDYWNRGTVTFQTGALAGCRPVEIFDWSSGGAVALWTDLAEAPQIGDTLTLRQGCEKTRAACLAYDNVVNFRGFPDVPGTDQVLRYPNPSA